MSFLADLFKKKKDKQVNKQDIYQAVFKDIMQKGPSNLFASGAVFDFTRNQHDEFERIVRSVNVIDLHSFFANSYISFCKNPAIVGVPQMMVNASNNDTDPKLWNTDIFELESDNFAALCYMPIQNETLEARLFGIILNSKGNDGYYYCMLNKNPTVNSDVKRNRAFGGTTKAGEVNGRGFDLMHSFLKCITEDFNQTPPTITAL